MIKLKMIKKYIPTFKKIYYLNNEEMILSILLTGISPSALGSCTRNTHLSTSSGLSKCAMPSVAKTTSRNPINLAPHPRFLCPYNLNTWNQAQPGSELTVARYAGLVLTLSTYSSQSFSFKTSKQRFRRTWGPTNPVGYWCLKVMYLTWIWGSVKPVCFSKILTKWGGQAMELFNVLIFSLLSSLFLKNISNSNSFLSKSNMVYTVHLLYL